MRSKGGFSILEMLIVLAIMGLTAALVFPQGDVLMDRVVAHAVFFDFQRQVADLRREAYRDEVPLVLYPSPAAATSDPRGRVIALRADWSYRLDRPVLISAGGTCSSASAVILDRNQKIMTLRTDQGDCRFIRLE
ncbi:MAG TPA: type II secretion system protein [Caulobacteraceae bacterium]